MRMSVESPPRVTETLITREMNSSINLPDATIANVYLASIEIATTGQPLISQSLSSSHSPPASPQS